MPSNFNKLGTYYVIQTVSSIAFLGTEAFLGCSGRWRFSMRYILHARENGKRANYMFVTLYLTSNYLQNVWLLYLIL